MDISADIHKAIREGNEKLTVIVKEVPGYSGRPQINAALDERVETVTIGHYQNIPF